MTRGRTSPARRVATRVLYRVAEKGAYATAALDAELGRERSGDQLGERDAALATEIVYGALRVLPALDRALDAHLKRPAIEPLLRAAMRVAAYQILHLGRVPVSAAVDEAVGLVRAE
ncbi:MAG: Sun protein, partial [Sandaracinaceae bacterium]|nr:Sun protein [Sandaracinaceae bacterium]